MKRGYTASLGKTNLKSGKAKDFNIYDTWGEDTTYEIYKVRNRGMLFDSSVEYRVVATAGTSALQKIGSKMEFVSSQPSRRFYFEGELVEAIVGSKLKEKIEEYGQYLKMYTYK